MRFLVLAQIGDETALRVYAALRVRHGAKDVKLVASEELVLAPYWAQRLEDERVSTEIRLGDGTVLDSENIGVVFNRIVAITMPNFALAKKEDRDYADQEMTALYLSWLASLPCPVVNEPSPLGLSAPMRSDAEWLLLAGRAGLPVQGYHFTTDPRWSRTETYLPHQWRPVSGDSQAFGFERVSGTPFYRQPTLYLEPLSKSWLSLLVAGQRLVGTLAGLYGEHVSRLAKLANCDLLEVIFTSAAGEQDPATAGNWKVCKVNPFPHTHSSEAILAIVQLLETKRTETRRGI
jgi:hypothetical protein